MFVLQPGNIDKFINITVGVQVRSTGDALAVHEPPIEAFADAEMGPRWGVSRGYSERRSWSATNHEARGLRTADDTMENYAHERVYGSGHANTSNWQGPFRSLFPGLCQPPYQVVDPLTFRRHRRPVHDRRVKVFILVACLPGGRFCRHRCHTGLRKTLTVFARSLDQCVLLLQRCGFRVDDDPLCHG